MDEEELQRWLNSPDFAKDVEIQRFRTKVKDVARACSTPLEGMPTPEELETLRAGQEVVMELSAMLTQSVESAEVDWDDLHFAGTFSNGRLDMVAGGRAASEVAWEHAVQVVSKVLQDNDLIGLVTVSM